MPKVAKVPKVNGNKNTEVDKIQNQNLKTQHESTKTGKHEKVSKVENP
jgi:hypothetical protein